jgi:hypothetical protein
MTACRTRSIKPASQQTSASPSKRRLSMARNWSISKSESFSSLSWATDTQSFRVVHKGGGERDNEWKDGRHPAAPGLA